MLDTHSIGTFSLYIYKCKNKLVVTEWLPWLQRDGSYEKFTFG